MAAASSILAGMGAIIAGHQARAQSDQMRSNQDFLNMKAEKAQEEMEKKIADQEAKAEEAGNLAKKRVRQKSKASQSTGRQSTILTSPLGSGDAGATAGGKSLLGL